MTKVSTKGQVTVPVKMRKWLGVLPGDKVSFTALDHGKALLQAVPREASPNNLHSNVCNSKNES